MTIQEAQDIADYYNREDDARRNGTAHVQDCAGGCVSVAVDTDRTDGFGSVVWAEVGSDDEGMAVVWAESHNGPVDAPQLPSEGTVLDSKCFDTIACAVILWHMVDDLNTGAL